MRLSISREGFRKSFWNLQGALAVLIFVWAFAVGLYHVPTTDYHRDESRWVGRAYFINELFHPGSETWADSDLTRNQPPLGSYLMGLGLIVQGHNTTTTVNRLLYDFNRSERWNQLRGRVPVLSDREAGRRTNSFMGALVAVLVFAAATRFTNAIGGIAAAAILIPDGLHIYLSSLAGSDMLLTFCVVAAIVCAIAVADRPTWWRVLLLGVILGLGGSAKLSPLLVAGVVGAYGVVLMIAGQAWRRRSDGERTSVGLGMMLLTVPFTAYATFVLSYPYLWPDPIKRTMYMFKFRNNEMDNQGDIWSNLQVRGVLDALQRIKLHLGEQYSVSGWLSRLSEERWGWGWNMPWLDVAFGVVGLGIVLLLACNYGLRSKYALAMVIIVAQLGVIIAGLEADFDRYYEPIVACFSIGTGVLAGSVAAVIAWAWRRYRQRGEATSTAPAAAYAGMAGASTMAVPPEPAGYRQLVRSIQRRSQLPDTAIAPRPSEARNRGAFGALLGGVVVSIGVVLSQILNRARNSSS